MKGKKKRKFQDFQEYTKNQNNNTFSKDDNNNYEDNNKENNYKNKYEFKSSLDKLIFIFPNFSSDFIKEVFEDNNNNFSRTKDFLTKLSEEELENKNEENQNKINFDNEKEKKINNNIIEQNKINFDNEKEKKINNNIIEEKKLFENNKDNYKNNNKDITHLAQFEIVDKDDNIEEMNKKRDEKKEEIYVIDQQKDKGNSENKNNCCNSLLDKKNKNVNEYYSIFNEESNNNNNIDNNSINNYSTKDDIIIDEQLFDQNIEFLCECFPYYTREQIVESICNLNFDIDAVVLNILNETNVNFEQNDDDLANLDITDKEEILSNFLGFDNGKQNDFDYELFQDNLVQKHIWESIKKENSKKSNKINEDELLNENEDNDNINDKKEENEEYFLNKNIDDIKTPKIKEDIKKLIKHFPLEEEFKIKLLYLQYMNYQMVYQHLSKDDTKNIGLKALLNSKDYKSYPKNSEIKKYNNKTKKRTNKYDISDEKRQYEIFKKIIDKKPINWKLEEDKNYNLNDYMAVRKRLIIEARNAYSNQKYKNGQILMAKAKRYKQEIDKIYKKHKIQQFIQNNENRNYNEIDLHSLNVQESKYIIDRKIKLLKEKKIENNLKSISLLIITGKGDHSNDYKPVLYPNILDWLKNRDKLSVKGDISQGIIFVTIY